MYSFPQLKIFIFYWCHSI